MESGLRLCQSIRCLAVVLLLSGSVAGCGDDGVGLSRNFLLRRPSDNPSSSTVTTFRAKPTSTDSINFEWEPSVGAASYRIGFWRADSRDSLNIMRGRFDNSIFDADVPSPMINMVRYSATDTTDQRRIKVVQHSVALSAVAAELSAAGIPQNQDIYVIWSVFARRGDKEQRSVELHRMIMRLED